MNATEPNCTSQACETSAHASCATGTVALCARNVSKQFGTRSVLRNISFEVQEGAFVSIFGPNGAGKTTLLRMLATLERPTSGTLSVQGFSLDTNAEQARACIGLLSHTPMMYGNLTAQENLEFYARMYGVQNAQQRIDDLLGEVGLLHRKHDRLKVFSQGMCQRLTIARALLHNPSIMLLDEPYAGLDPYAVDVFDTLLERIVPYHTCVMVSHDISHISPFSQKSLLLARGEIYAYKDSAAVTKDDFSALYAPSQGRRANAKRSRQEGAR